MAATAPPSIVVTGASSGIGAASSLHLARQGWQVFAGVRREDDGDRLRTEFMGSSGPDIAQPGAVRPILLDVTRHDDIARAVDLVQSRLGEAPLTGLLNNAGWLCMGPLEVIPIDDVRRQLEVNTLGVLATTQAFLPLLRRGPGRIVQISSVSGLNALPFMGPYAASKFALEALSDSMRVELHRFGVRVSLIEPGPIETPLLHKNLDWLNHLEGRMSDADKKLYEHEMKLVRHFAEASGDKALPVSHVVEAVLHALTAKRPKARYRVGRGTAGVGFLHKLPVGLRDWLIRWKLGRVRVD